MSLTQSQISTHLDLDQSAVSRFLAQEKIDWKTATLDEIRLAYIRKLRAQSESYRTEDADLVMERILTERVDRELKEFALVEKKAQLINPAQLEPMLIAMFDSWRSSVKEFDKTLKAKIDTRYGIDADRTIFERHAEVAFSHLSPYVTKFLVGRSARGYRG